MRALILIGIFALGGVASTGMAQSLHPPVTTFPIDSATQSAAPVPVAKPSRPTVAAVPAPASAPVSVPATTASSVSAPTPRPVVTERVGDITQQLLAAQAQGLRAGIDQPMLGATATAAWTRYINSFNHPIPEWFEETVDTK